MPRFTVAHRYEAVRDGRRLGPWVAGDEINLDADDAAWVEVDSPGALVLVVVEKPRPNRQHSSSKARS